MSSSYFRASRLCGAICKNRFEEKTESPNQPVFKRFADIWTTIDQFTRGGVEDTRLEAKAKDTKKIRGQGQRQPFRGQTLSRPRTGMLETKDTATSVLQKKGLQNFFSGDLQFIGVPRIFDWGRPKSQITCYDVIKIFQKRKFLWDKDIVGWKV